MNVEALAAADAESIMPPAEARPTLAVLDGVRGISILMVLVHHVCLIQGSASQADVLIERITRPLWTGVDLLFLLSGFLITKSLVEVPGRTSIANFYVRRSLRILPLYLVSLVFFLVLFPAMPWQGFEQFRQIDCQGALSFWMAFMNYHYSVEAAPGNLGHFWSLCVEIHFYLLWPLLLLGFRNRVMPLCLGGIFLVSTMRVLSIKTGLWTPELGYHASHLRFDSLLWGALVFAINHSYGDDKRLQRWLPRLFIPFAVIAATFLVFGRTRSSESGNLFGFPAVDISFAIFLLLVLRQRQGFISAVLLTPFVRFAGKLSYAIYVFHFPLLLLCRELLFHGDFPEWHGMVWPAALLTGALALPLTFLVAWISWHVLEKPCLSLKRRFA